MPHGAIARIVVGLAATLALAILAAHPRVRRLTDRFGLNAIASTGFPFLVLGMVFHHPNVGILGDTVLSHLQPAFEFGLGWIGFAVGMQFDLRALDAMPRGTSTAVAVQAVAPMATCALVCGGVLIALGIAPSRELARDVLVITACGAASAAISHKVPFLARHGEEPARRARALTEWDEIVALAVLGLVSVYFRPAGVVHWQLPSSAWLLVALGVGALQGILTFALLRGARRHSERIALLLGAVAFAAGMSSALSLSVPVTCAMAGALLANLPVKDGDALRRLLSGFERPLYLVFLVVVGATWDPRPWQGWVLAGAFTIARLYGKVLGARLAVQVLPGLPPRREITHALMAQSPISIVVIVAASIGNAVSDTVAVWAIHAVIVSSVVTELVLLLLRGRELADAPPVPLSIPPPPAASHPPSEPT